MKISLAASAAVLAAVMPVAAHADSLPFVSPMFTDNMVLQRGIPDPVWGWAAPGATVTVRMDGKTSTATAGSDGKWMTRIGPFKEGGPYTLEVAGPQAATFRNVLVGDVWVCSGQSNMEFGIGNIVNPAPEIAKANYPEIRLFTVTKKIAADPQQTLTGQWDPCTPETVAHGGWNGFSAVGYYFGRDLYQDLKVPIGLIHTSWGGTPAEAWTSAQALSTIPDFAPRVEQYRAARAAAAGSGYSLAAAVAEWYRKNDPGSAATPNWGDPATDAAAWPTMNLPGYWEAAGVPALSAFDGIVWYRREVDIPAENAGKNLTLRFFADDNDSAYVNGTLVGHSEGYLVHRGYTVPARLLKPGRNVIAIRVLDTAGNGGVYGTPDQLALDVPGGQPISLAGPWQYRVSTRFTAATPYPSDVKGDQNSPMTLYNGMIAPVVPFGIKGAIWYQGESNAGRAFQYRSLLPTMIRDWRSAWGEGDFPFYIVQLANFQAQPTTPGDSDWAELREAQLMTAQNVKNSGEAVIIDLGDAKDIHPKDKADVGARLALVARAKTYGEKVEYSGPAYRSMKIEGGAIRLNFDHAASGMVAKDGPLKGFSIAGDDHKWVWADAKIDGDSVVVSSSEVSHPVAVRYAWANNPVCNLYNGAGLPASPFRTDNWPGVTVGRK